MKARQAGLPFIFITLLLDVLGIGLLIPVGPHLVQELSGGGSDADASRIVGYLGATYAVMLFVFSPLLGALSDRFGRRPVLLTAMLGSGLDYFAMAMVPSVGWLFVTRVINGLSGASITAASAYITDVTPPEKRAAGFGIVGAAFGLGFVLGPWLGGVLGEHDLRLPFWAAGAITLVNWLYGFFVLPESLPREKRRSADGFRWNPFRALGILGRNHFALHIAIALFLLNLAQFALHATWVLYCEHRYGWGPQAVGYSLLAVGLGAAVVQGGLARRLIPRLGERRSVLTGFLVGATAYLAYGLATDGWMIYVAVAFASLGGIAMPAMQSLVTKTVRHDEQGQVQGALTGVQSLANVFGPLLGSQVFAWSIARERTVNVPGLVFFVCASVAVLALGFALHALREAHFET